MEAMNQSKADVFAIEAGQAVDTDKQLEQKTSDDEKIEDYIRELVECGYDAQMARKSVNHVIQADINSSDVVTQGKGNWDIENLFVGPYEMAFGSTKGRKIRHGITLVIEFNKKD